MTRTLWRKLWRDIRANRGQTLALIVLIALGIASFVAMIGAYRDLSLSYEHTYEQLRFADLTVKLLGAPQSVVDEVARLDGVAAAMGRYVVDTGYDAGETTLRARLIGIASDRRPPVNDLLIIEGRFFQPGETGVALLEKHFAEAHDIHPDDTITPILDGQTVALKVVGIVASPEYLIVSPSRYEIIPANRTFAVIFTPLDDLQRRLAIGDTINEIAVRLDTKADPALLENRLRENLAPYGVAEIITREEQPSNAALQLDVNGFRQMAYAIPALMLFVALMALSMLVGRLVHSQRPLIGVMLAFGHTRRTVLRFFLLLALTIGILGALAGIVLGVPLGSALTSAYAHELGIPLVKTRLHPDAMLLAVALSLLTAILAAIAPARQATQVEPATAMRQDPALSVVAVRPSLLERLWRLPLMTRLALRNLSRNRRRTIGTWLALVLTMVLLLVSLALVDSMNTLLRTYFEEVERWDMLVVLQHPQPMERLQDLQTIDGVADVTPVLQVPARLHATGTEEVLLSAMPPTTTMHKWQLARGLPPEEALAPGHLIITRAMADALSVHIGDTVEVETPYGRRELRIGGISDEMVGPLAYMRLDEAQDLVGAPVWNSAHVRLNGADQTVQAALYRVPGVAVVQQKAEMRREWQALMGLFYAVVGVMLLFAVLMGGAVLFNTMSMNVLERRREFATMRAMGTTYRHLRRLLGTEVVTLWALAVPPGIIAGYWVAVQFGRLFDSELMTFRVAITPLSYVGATLAVLLAAWVATWPSLRGLKRLNLAEAIRERIA